MAPPKLVAFIIGSVALATVAGGAGYIVATHTIATAALPSEPVSSPTAGHETESPSHIVSAVPRDEPATDTPAQNIVVMTTEPPPPLPVYVVPEPPEENLVWEPGHWRWSDRDYFWVPGTWVHPPRTGVFWTPGYWQWMNGSYGWHEGYWAPHVGYYGGIHYGGGYNGNGFHGGEWNGNTYIVNRSVTNITNNVTTIQTHTSISGGPEGERVEPTLDEQHLTHEEHAPATSEQIEHRAAARQTPAFGAATNHGVPPIAATPRPNIVRSAGETPKQPELEKPAAQPSEDIPREQTPTAREVNEHASSTPVERPLHAPVPSHSEQPQQYPHHNEKTKPQEPKNDGHEPPAAHSN